MDTGSRANAGQFPEERRAAAAIAVASPSSIWAAGLYPLEGPFAGETPYVLHFNGKAWTRVHTPAIAGVRLWSAADVGSNAWFAGDHGAEPHHASSRRILMVGDAEPAA